MISERKFAVAHTSFWRDATPSAENFLRHVNLTTIRYIAPYESRSPIALNGVINEAAFRLAATMKTSRGEKPTNEMIERVWAQVIQWIGELYLGPNKLTSKISLDISAIAERINFYIIFRGCERVDFSPNFPGCGIISSCDGDILADDVLIEVKAGGRKFRATDLRQLFIYSALAWKSRDTNIKSICLLNPRWGVAWTATLEDAAIGCGANSGVELAEDIVRGAILLGTSK